MNQLKAITMLRLLALSILLAGPAAAQNIAFGGIKADTKAPVEISSDNLLVNQNDGTAVFTGNVVIGQGEMRLSAPKVTVDYTDGDQRRIERLHATGGVTLVNGPDAAESSEAVYQVGSGDITLIGEVVLTQGQNVLTGEKMFVNLEDGTARVEGRVRSILQPGEN